MYVRWLGGFRKNGSLEESLNFEISRATSVACEKLVKGVSVIPQSRVGFLVDPKAVYKNFKHDVWSEYTTDGSLVASRSQWEATSNHRESWAKPVFTGIVVKGGGFDNLSPKARKVVAQFATTHNLPVYKLSGGKLKKEVVRLK